MAGKNTDRKGKGKDLKSTANEQADMATFTLPDSLPCSEIEFPVLTKKSMKANWQEILEESEERLREIAEYAESKQEKIPKAPFLRFLVSHGFMDTPRYTYIQDPRMNFIAEMYNAQAEPDCLKLIPFTETECEYITKEVFIHLIPALEETLNKAKIWEALVRQKCFFNGIDHIVQLLWNNNPRYPERKMKNLHLFNMQWVRNYLSENPRPYYPKSWLWPEDYAATMIQKTVRQYFVQREDEVQEMREFWRKLEVERHVPDIETNPFLAKKFATELCAKK